MRKKCYLTLATGRMWLISYKLRLFHMGRDVGQIFQTASFHRDHSHIGKNNGNPDLVCKNKISNIWPESSSLSLICVRAMTILGCA